LLARPPLEKRRAQLHIRNSLIQNHLHHVAAEGQHGAKLLVLALLFFGGRMFGAP
jgi:hypothetical protein